MAARHQPLREKRIAAGNNGAAKAIGIAGMRQQQVGFHHDQLNVGALHLEHFRQKNRIADICRQNADESGIR